MYKLIKINIVKKKTKNSTDCITYVFKMDLFFNFYNQIAFGNYCVLYNINNCNCMPSKNTNKLPFKKIKFHCISDAQSLLYIIYNKKILFNLCN